MKKLRTKLKDNAQGRSWWFVNGSLLLMDITDGDKSTYYEIKLSK